MNVDLSALADELDARAEAAKYLSMNAEDEGEGFVEWGRYYGYAGAAKLLRKALS